MWLAGAGARASQSRAMAVSTKEANNRGRGARRAIAPAPASDCSSSGAGTAPAGRGARSRWRMTTQRRPGRSVARSPGSARSRRPRCLGRRSTGGGLCGKSNEAKVRIRRDESLPSSGDPKASCSGQPSSVGSSTLASARRGSVRVGTPRRRQSATQAIRLSMLSTFRRVCATSTSSTRSSTRSGCSTMSCAKNLRLPSRVAFENMYVPSRWPMSGSPNGSIRSGGLRMTPNGAPTSARRDTRLGASSAKATDNSAPSELATTSTVGSSSASTTSRRNVRPWSNRSTPR